MLSSLTCWDYHERYRGSEEAFVQKGPTQTILSMKSMYCLGSWEERMASGTAASRSSSHLSPLLCLVLGHLQACSPECGRENQQQLQAHVPLRQQSQEKANFSFPIVLATVHSDEPTLDPTPIPELTPDSDWPDLACTASSGTWGLGQRGFPKGKLGFCHQKRLNCQKQ